MSGRMEIFDIHTHVLPGIDDGAENWDMSMEMLKAAWDSGVRKVIATPHFLPWDRQISPNRIRRMCREAGERFSERYGQKIRIYPGEELYYHSELLDDLKSGRAMTMNGTDCVLVEFGVMVQYGNLLHAVQKMQRAGYTFILAHYERYKALRDEAHIEELLDLGVMLQSNLEALEGGIFDPEVRRIRRDYRKGRISFAASEMHDLKARPPVQSGGVKRLSKLLDRTEARRVLYENASVIFRQPK